MYQTKIFEKPVYYLQRNDFDDNGNLIVPELRNKKVIIMNFRQIIVDTASNAKEIIIKQQSNKRLEKNGRNILQNKVVFANYSS